MADLREAPLPSLVLDRRMVKRVLAHAGREERAAQDCNAQKENSPPGGDGAPCRVRPRPAIKSKHRAVLNSAVAASMTAPSLRKPQALPGMVWPGRGFA